MKCFNPLALAGIGLLFSTQTYAQEGTIYIEQDPNLAQLVEIYKEVRSETDFYQIQVGFGTYEQARKLKSKVEIDFPGWYSKIEFLSPTYRVRLGKFYNSLEAQRKYREVRRKYPNAVLLEPDNKQ